MSVSSALEVYLSLREEDPDQPPPLFFHHVPKTAGTSFRAAVGLALEPRATKVAIPDVRDILNERGDWPGGIVQFYRRAVAFGRPVAVLSHYTNYLAAETDRPILALIREPEAQFWSSIHFRSRNYARLGANRIVERHANMQVRSLAGMPSDHAIPLRKPRGPRKLGRWIELIEQLAERMTLFRTEEYGAMLEHCRDVYGLTLKELHKKGPQRQRRKSLLPERAETDIRAIAEANDPVWLDRMLYERVRLGQLPDALRAAPDSGARREGRRSSLPAS